MCQMSILFFYPAGANLVFVETLDNSWPIKGIYHQILIKTEALDFRMFFINSIQFMNKTWVRDFWECFLKWAFGNPKLVCQTPFHWQPQPSFWSNIRSLPSPIYRSPWKMGAILVEVFKWIAIPHGSPWMMEINLFLWLCKLVNISSLTRISKVGYIGSLEGTHLFVGRL